MTSPTEKTNSLDGIYIFEATHGLHEGDEMHKKKGTMGHREIEIKTADMPIDCNPFKKCNCCRIV